MGRLFVYLAILATVIGFIVLMPAGGPEAGAPTTRDMLPQVLPVAAGWIAGLAMGFMLSWLSRIDWRTLPEQIALWIQVVRHRVWWMAFGGICAGFLLFF